jgi:hypothetical protein
MPRTYIHRSYVGGLVSAQRLELADDGSFSLLERVYYGDDGTENTATGRWREDGGVVSVTAAQSEISLVRPGVEARFEIDRDGLMIAGQRFEPDRS